MEEGHYNTDGSWTTTSAMFLSLTPDEVEQFRQYAIDNPRPDDFDICHPVCRETWDSQWIKRFTNER